MPLNKKIGGHVDSAKDKETNYLTIEQARHIYKKVESQGAVNVDTIKQEIEDETLSREKDSDINPCQKIILNNIDKDNIKTSQMEHWSILSNVVNFVQYDNPKNLPR